ncbi:MAG: hypothetical protein IPP79_21740 [Chitinophagaceae bacterium]|nr:hypothetical protein [Chitinophagaceae bacterium]
MKNDKISRIVLVLEILLIVLLHMSKGTASDSKELVNSSQDQPSQAVMSTVQPLTMAK